MLVRKAEKSIWDGLAAKGRGTWGDTHLGMQTVILSHCMACQLLVKWKIWWHKGLATYTKWLLWFFYILKCENTKLRKLSQKNIERDNLFETMQQISCRPQDGLCVLIKPACVTAGEVTQLRPHRDTPLLPFQQEPVLVL